MKYNPDIHHRRSVRLQGYDYSQQGAYYITIVTHNRECLFGDVAGEEIHLNTAGEITKKCWQLIPEHYPNIILDYYVVMPNHIHGIIFIDYVGVQHLEPLQIKNQHKQNRYQHIIPKSIGSIVRGFKIGVTKWFRQNTDIQKVWQRNYYEHIIHNENDLNQIREYITYNLLNWDTDEENPFNRKMNIRK